MAIVLPMASFDEINNAPNHFRVGILSHFGALVVLADLRGCRTVTTPHWWTASVTLDA
jgi:hypothetical protein